MSAGDALQVRQPGSAELGRHAPSPLFTTDDDFITATERLIAHKALDGEGRP